MNLFHPAGSWRYEANPARRAPSRAELRGIFDEHDKRGDLSADSWVALRRLAEELDGQPLHAGQLVMRPDSDEFDAELLEGEVPSTRIDALAASEVTPTEEELARWREIYMEGARADGEPGVSAVYVRRIVDDHNRERLLIALHGDEGTFERIAGMFVSLDEATVALRRFGDLEWFW